MIPPINPTSSISAVSPANFAPTTPASAAPTSGAESFSNVLGTAIDQLNTTTSNASTLALQGATGQANIGAVTVAATEAQLAVQLVSTVRNEGVTAFNSIMSMVAG